VNGPGEYSLHCQNCSMNVLSLWGKGNQPPGVPSGRLLVNFDTTLGPI